MNKTIIIVMLLLSSCATTSVNTSNKQRDIINCIKELNRDTNASTNEGFEVCRQLYGLRKLQEGAKE